MAAECIFCKIAAKEIPAHIVYESAQVLALTDINPEAPVHLLIIPKKHLKDIVELADADCSLFAEISLAIKQLAADNHLDKGFRVVTNCGAGAGQSVDHLHFHLLGGRDFAWPPG